MILLLGNCIALGEHTLLPEITSNPNVTTKHDYSLTSRKWRKEISAWFLKKYYNQQKVADKEILRTAFKEKQKQEKKLAFPNYIKDCVNVSTYGATFLGIHQQCKMYLKNNHKPDLVLITDFPFENRGIAIHHNQQKFIIESAMYFVDHNPEFVPKQAYQKFLDKRKLQEKVGETFINKKRQKSYKLLIKFLHHHNLKYKFIIFYKKNKNFFAEHNYIDCTSFVDQFTNSDGYQLCAKKLELQKPIAEHIKKHI
jgi:hypothetical protein